MGSHLRTKLAIASREQPFHSATASISDSLPKPKHVHQRPYAFSRKFMVRELGRVTVSIYFVLRLFRS